MTIKEVLQELTAEGKAWAYFKKLLDDDEKFDRFKNGKKPIEIVGNEGGIYFLYPSGDIARIDDDKPMKGNIYFNDAMHKVDFLSTLLIWITTKEKDLKRVWGCGGLSMIYNGKNRDVEINTNIGNPMNNLREPQVNGFLTGTYIATYIGTNSDWSRLLACSVSPISGTVSSMFFRGVNQSNQQ